MGSLYENNPRGQYKRPESDSEIGQVWGKAIGPFYTAEGVARELGLSEEEIGQLVANSSIITVQTSDHITFFPSRQLVRRDDGTTTINPAVAPALAFLIEHEEEFSDVRELITERGTRLVDEWTIAATLLQPNEVGETLLEDLELQLDKPDGEAWTRLKTLNGMATGIRIVVFDDKSK
jgi:hypothetical protein